MTKGYNSSIQDGQMSVNNQKKFSSTSLNYHMHAHKSTFLDTVFASM
jgi:hypothetical protein